ncbi:MAG TPA: hypothetical protein PLT06_11290, partial [Syntrophorhabdaceae bacterium]|nr:hypothetical protein [Syntrophorhabdaceae bacterium]
PHIPHNIPEGKVGKPEGLSGSQTENSSPLRLLLHVPRATDSGKSAPFKPELTDKTSSGWWRTFRYASR